MIRALLDGVPETVAGEETEHQAPSFNHAEDDDA